MSASNRAARPGVTWLSCRAAPPHTGVKDDMAISEDLCHDKRSIVSARHPSQSTGGVVSRLANTALNTTRKLESAKNQVGKLGYLYICLLFLEEKNALVIGKVSASVFLSFMRGLKVLVIKFSQHIYK